MIASLSKFAFVIVTNKLYVTSVPISLGTDLPSALNAVATSESHFVT